MPVQHRRVRGPVRAQLDERPGVLRGGATLTLQTRQAQRLVKGRGYSAEKPAIIGLIGFANLVRTLWHGARADDPYADWWLLKVHDALGVRRSGSSSPLEQGIVDAIRGAWARSTLHAPASIKPARIALNFSNPYAFRAAGLIGRFDALVCKVLSARHVGLLGRDEAERTLHQGGRWVRRALQSAGRLPTHGGDTSRCRSGDRKGTAGPGGHGRDPRRRARAVRSRAPHAPTVASRDGDRGDRCDPPPVVAG